MIFKLCDRDTQNWATSGQIGGNGSDAPGFTATTVYNLHAGKYWFYFYIPSNTDNATCFMIQAPHIPAFLAPKKITGATNASPIVITTSTPHGYSNGETIKCLYVAGNTAANVQTNSANFGYNLAAKWTGTGYMVIDEKELRLACRDRLGAIGDLVRDSNLANILSVTLGYKGSVTYQEGGYVEHFPPIASSVVDTIGAGDAFLSITAPLVALDMPLEVVGLLGNAYGSMKVSIFGNRPVDAIEFKQFIKGLLV